MSKPTTTDDGRRNVVLTGFMGTGKTTIGRMLAAELGYEFVDTDRVIEERHGAIADIFARAGEAAFRDLERKLAAELGERHGLVVSTGGRMVLDPSNAEALGRHGVIVCLTARADTILTRISSGRTRRPLLDVVDPLARIVELLGERAEGYARFPQFSTDDVHPSAVAHRIAAFVRR
jgi:shikimate kinase